MSGSTTPKGKKVRMSVIWGWGESQNGEREKHLHPYSRYQIETCRCYSQNWIYQSLSDSCRCQCQIELTSSQFFNRKQYRVGNPFQCCYFSIGWNLFKRFIKRDMTEGNSACDPINLGQNTSGQSVWDGVSAERNEGETKCTSSTARGTRWKRGNEQDELPWDENHGASMWIKYLQRCD